MLWLIDEVFKGTNNRERLIGGRALITALAGGNGFGLVTTHDLELSELERRLPDGHQCALSGNRRARRTAFRLSAQTRSLPDDECPPHYGPRRTAGGSPDPSS